MSKKQAEYTPKEIVEELNRFIIGQDDAKRAVAIALRNRWRRMQLDPAMREEVLPKNILMVGPTGVGKTEIARRLAKLAKAPFVKVEATKYTEKGYVGGDVEQIIRDLLDVSINLTREKFRAEVKSKAEAYAEERVLAALIGKNASSETKETYRCKLRKGELDKEIIEIDVIDHKSNILPSFDIPGMPGAQMGMLNLSDIFGKGFGATKTKRRKMSVAESYETLIQDESDKLLDEEKVIEDAIENVEENGIVFIDEIDKISVRHENKGGDVSREGVQRDLLPLIEGTNVSTKHGIVRTDHILFIASGAFHIAKPSDLLPELQGRLPIRVELQPLSKEDFKRILTEPENSLIKQYIALIGTEGVELKFDKDAIEHISELSSEINASVENIGARRLHTVLEKLLDEISFNASDEKGKSYNITKVYVDDKIASLTKKMDLSRFIL